MKPKKVIRALLFPHIAIMLMLVPVSAVFMVYSMIFSGTRALSSIISYVLAFYTLTVWCINLIRFFRAFGKENRYALRWRSDTRLRVRISLYGTLMWNTAYAVFQLGLGFYHHTFWYYSLAAYYICLAVMRFFLLRHTSRHRAGENIRSELIRYRACGAVLLVMNIALALIVFFMVYWDRTFIHHEITTIAMAAYTFTALTFAIVNSVRYRKYNSPVYSAAKVISLVSACVSMLTLEATMLTTFNDGSMSEVTRRIFLAASGGAVSAFIIVMAIYMIVKSNRRLKHTASPKEIQ